VVLSVVTVFAVAGCASGAGLTQAEVAGMSLEDEFALASERYAEMQSVLEEAQVQVSDGAWQWNGGEVLPVTGGPDASGEPLPGADESNSYLFRAGRILEPQGATGVRSDLDPMIEYFDEKGWRSGSREVAGEYETRADTGEGWWLSYTVRPNGQYSLAIDSEVFWTNDSSELRLAIGKRDVTPFPEESVPGVFEPFPSWTDPVQP